jgi:hypothetical protein
MKKEFLPYEQALALKELGFDEPCFAYFKDEEFQYPNPYEPFKNSEMKSWCITAPLYQQVFRWFREKHNISSFVKRDFKDTEMIGYYYGVEGTEIDIYSKNYNSYEEAEFECIKKLIEIIKN